MLGIVFSEFIEMVENNISEDIADQLIDIAEEKFPGEGIYTSVGDYDHGEILVLVGELSQLTNMPVPDLVHAYGKHLFGRFNDRYPTFFENMTGSIHFLEGIESRIHSEVRKLYPNSELPEFTCERPNEHTLIMHYHSARPFALLAHGLIEGCIEHFGDALMVTREDTSGDAFTDATFTISKALIH